MSLSIGVVIPTFQAAKHLPHCLPPLLQSPLNPRILIIDSSSKDDTIALAKSMGVETLVISQNEFNHGLTREKGRQFLRTDIIVMMTQDAYATSSSMLEQLVAPLIRREASISYARQIPHQNASFFASFPRQFNYPSNSHIRSIKDVKKYGVYTFFCSNSCAAYLNTALDEIGGFSPVLFGEDTVAVAKLLQNKHLIAYVAEAEVHHSHDYTLKQEFCRHFDIGYARLSYANLLESGGKDTKRGEDYVKALFNTLKKQHPELIPYALLQTLVKLLGYKCGQASLYAPLWLKRALSSQKYYWKNNP